MQSFFYIILALLGIGFLIFIHELGHYFIAIRKGITVEVFSIGFGKAIREWERNGVKWKICVLPFGGYVKMSGMAKEGELEPYEVEGGYFAAKPWNRIQVALAGPFVNIVFAFLAFTFLWAIGGRNKPFTEHTQIIGWVKKDSGPYEANIRAGDQITKLNDRPYRGYQEFLYGGFLDTCNLQISGYQLDYETKRKVPYTYTFSSKERASGSEKAVSAMRSIGPASYLIYDKMPSGAENPLLPGSPLENSGISYGDRIFWVDGELIFSSKQLVSLINAPKVLLTVERDGRTFLTRVPRLQIKDMRLTTDERAEFDDWRNEARLKSRVNELFFIPYNLDPKGSVEEPLSYIDQAAHTKLPFEVPDRSPMEIPLLPGDQIIAAQGTPIDSSYALLKELQEKQTLVIVKKTERGAPILWTKANEQFIDSFPMADLEKLTQSVGTGRGQNKVGELTLLRPVKPIAMSEFPLTKQQGKDREGKITEAKKTIDEIKDSKKKEAALEQLKSYQNRLMLGLNLQDELVAYNPPPLTLFVDVLKETYQTLYALLTGYLSPKVLSGPVGMIQVIHYGWSVGVKEALFWLGMISLNLGLLNLLPIPILDGGHICFSIWEMITKKPLKAKTMERMIIPFYILFIMLFVYLTYNDIARIITNLF